MGYHIINNLLNGECISNCEDDPRLIEYIKSNMIHPSGSKPKLVNPKPNMGQTNQVAAVLKHFKNKVS